MEILAGLLGTVVGVVLTFSLSEWRKGQQGRRNVVAAMRAEFSVARRLANDVLDANRPFMESVSHDEGGGWRRCEITVFPTAAWSAVVGSGGISELSVAAIDAASEAHASTLRANYVAEKIMRTGFKPPAGRHYNELVRNMETDLGAALNELP